MLSDSLKIVVDPKYDNIKFFKNKNYITVSKNGKYAILDSNLKTIIDFKYKSIEFQKDDKSIKVVTTEGTPLMIDFNDHLLKQISYEEKRTDGGGIGLYPAKLKGRWGFVNAADEWVIPAKFLQVRSFKSDGMTMVQLENGKSTLINNKGELIGKFMYDNFGDHYLGPGIVVVEIDSLWGYNTNDETVLIAPTYQDARAFDDKGMARVKIQGKWGYVNKAGIIVIPAIYAWVNEFDKNEWSIVDNGNKKRNMGLINRRGESPLGGSVICRYDYITAYAFASGTSYTATVDGKDYSIDPKKP